ncbi:Dyp-type peroxidase [Nocardia aurantia]|uniref:Multifunctional dye peroxidase DyP2 n=1 Tax=Nocardia aurantia TaxID=2585199 RepID=A0A7K0DNS9_9NOCA|nr:Dyp-type peroxidase [Nocardia aurantia]MQY27406.1 Multifunctional dye peroxidase DyP2 [Nocardia aurantia]
MTPREPRLALEDIQGDVIPGFKNDCQTFLFYKLIDVARARTWLASMHAELSTAEEVDQGNRLFSEMRRRRGADPDRLFFVWLNIALSATALRALTASSDVDQFDDEAFKNGMAEGATALGDPAGSTSTWRVGGDAHPVDVVIVLASDHPELIASQEQTIDRAAQAAGLALVDVERGRVLPGALAGHEHFGFKDGISEPAVRGTRSEAPEDYFVPRTIPRTEPFEDYSLDYAAPGRTLIWPGHVLFGYGRQDPAKGPRVVADNLRPIGPAWADNGSFMVFRRLRQDVRAFDTFVQDAAASLTASHPQAPFSADLVGACLVGRWKSGTPIMRAPREDLRITGEAANYFLYDNAVPGALPGDPAPLAAADEGGTTCPAAAHIRKVNPRDSATDIGGAGKTVPKLILRRGIPYGEPYDAATPGSADLDRGLLFVCFQSSIDNQFAFLMQRWTNQDDRPVQLGVTGHDAVMGEPARPRNFTFAISPPATAMTLPDRWVSATGGEYFFMPSISFFRDTLGAVDTGHARQLTA